VLLSSGFTVNIGNDTSLCYGEIIHLNASTPGGTFIWQDGSHQPGFTVNSPGTYWVNVNSGSCFASDTIQVAYTNVSLYLGEDLTLCGQDNLLIIAHGNFDSILWSTGSTDDSVIITHPGKYFATITKNGCQASDTVEVKTCSEIWFPNAFSPNDDAFNDIFMPKAVNVEDFDMMIFNRWGALLYETTEVSKGWDGTYKGKKCPQGVYFYIAHFKMWENGLKVKKASQGSVTLIK